MGSSTSTYEQAGGADTEQGVVEHRDHEEEETEGEESSEGEGEGEGEQQRNGEMVSNPLIVPATEPFEWNTRRVVAHPPKVHNTCMVQCDVNLSRESLRLIPIADEAHEDEEEDESTPSSPARYQLQFNFDANVSCSVKVYLIGQEKRDEENKFVGFTSAYNHTCPPPTHFSTPGVRLQYLQPTSHPLDVSLYSEAELAYDPATQTFPVIITLEPNRNDKRSKQKISSQTTFATLLKCTDGSYVIKPIKVKIEYDGATYVVHDIFGLDKDALGDSGKECVVCMTDPRDTVVLPCRHMCLCSACAEVLRYQTTKCPICRSKFTSLLKIDDRSKKGHSEGGEKKTKKTKKNTKASSSSSSSSSTPSS